MSARERKEIRAASKKERIVLCVREEYVYRVPDVNRLVLIIFALAFSVDNIQQRLSGRIIIKYYKIKY